MLDLAHGRGGFGQYMEVYVTGLKECKVSSWKRWVLMKYYADEERSEYIHVFDGMMIFVDQGLWIKRGTNGTNGKTRVKFWPQPRIQGRSSMVR
jgi:hypothetical protein